METKTFKIITLGVPGAGKTVFLASMFKALSKQRDYNLFFEIENQMQRDKLESIYREIATNGIWPDKTRYGQISEWTFNCCVRTQGKEYIACKFTYFDYAGGRLFKETERDEEFEQKVKQSDAILGLIDGQKIHSWMSDIRDLSTTKFLNEDLPSIIQNMQKSRAPIHFVISKWDLIESKFSLGEVRDRLFTIPQFRELVESRNKAGSPVRLIPVSSVGLDFVTPQDDGNMQKIFGATLHPFQVVVPVACVLPDKLKALLGNIGKKKIKLETSFLVKVASWLGYSLDAANVCMNGLDINAENDSEPGNDDKFNKLGLVIGIAKLVIKPWVKYKLKKLDDIRNEEQALNYVFAKFLDIQEQFTYEVPDSELKNP